MRPDKAARLRELQRAQRLYLSMPPSTRRGAGVDIREIERNKAAYLVEHGEEAAKAAFPVIWPELWPHILKRLG